MPASNNRKLIDLTGQVFERLTVISEAPRTGAHGYTRNWNCTCACSGQPLTVPQELLLQSANSCGCLKREKLRAARTTHGLRHTPEYNSWAKIKGRCFRTTDAAYDGYGGRGIAMCEGIRNDFPVFYRIVGVKPTPAHSIDRKDNNGNYSCGECPQCLANGWPMNMRWATPKEQANNTRATKWLTDGNETLSQAEWARRLGIQPSSLEDRLKSGMSEHDAVTTPARR